VDIDRMTRAATAADAASAAYCVLCGEADADVTRPMPASERKAALCDTCAIASFGTFAGHAQHVAHRVIEAILVAQGSRAPYALVDPLFVALLAVSEDELGACYVVYERAMDLGYEERARQALEQIRDAERTIRCNLVSLYLTLGDRAAFASMVGVLEEEQLSDEETLWLDTHKAMAAFNPMFGCEAVSVFAREEVLALVERARAGGDPGVLAHALAAAGAAAADHAEGLRLVDEAIALGPEFRYTALRGDLLRHHAPEESRQAWESALARVHPDSIDAARLRGRLRATAR
jgi:hypothetical protein